MRRSLMPRSSTPCLNLEWMRLPWTSVSRMRAPLIAAIAWQLAGCGALNPFSSSRPGTSPVRSEPAIPTASPHSSSAPAAKPAPVVQRRGGGYYQDDGPGDNAPPNLEQTPDAVPQNEPILRSATNRSYVVFGKTYNPITDSRPFTQRGVGSWYGRKFHGQKTSSGEPYNMYAMTAAHPTLPIPSYVRVTNIVNGRSVVVRVNDRGPFHSDRVIDLSYTAALKLDYVNQGSTQVEVVRVTANDRPPLLAQNAGVPAIVPAPVPSPAPKPAPTNGSGDMPLERPAPGASSAVVPAGSVAVAAPVAQPAAVEPATTALATSTQPDGVYLQIGAFGARDNAESFRARVSRDLAWLTETVYIVAGSNINRVQVGPYKNRDDAGKIAEKIRESLQLKPVFVLR